MIRSGKKDNRGDAARLYPNFALKSESTVELFEFMEHVRTAEAAEDLAGVKTLRKPRGRLEMPSRSTSKSVYCQFAKLSALVSLL